MSDHKHLLKIEIPRIVLDVNVTVKVQSDAAQAARLTDTLADSTDALEKAVKDNQPKT